ncbi:copper uptake system-associated protein [Achromobacter spanius]|uniref:copper uptake system-associated protein n=1 Tax=Achromobacter spanius TaxID=217203 RepID=UPI0032087847
MHAYRKNLAVFLVSIAATFSCLTASADPSDANAAAKAMRDIWDKPEAPLVVEPVSVEGDYALAGWVQQERGGRALLRKVHGQWRVHVCGGDGLKDTEALAMAGMSSEAAAKLSAAASEAEAKLPAAQRAKFALFGQNIVVDTAHGAH